MKKQYLWLLLMFYFPAWAWAESGVVEALNNYAWEKRQVIVFSPTANHPQYQLTNQLAREFRAEFDDRRLQIWRVVENQAVTLNNQERANLNSQQFQQHFSVNPEYFRLILVGYDQGEKLRQSQVDVDRLFAEIDQMPMRQQEMAEKTTVIPVKQEQNMEDAMIDDRRSGTMETSLGGKWQLISDQVMGGVSSGSATITEKDGRSCVQMTGNVSTDNNGGFLQIALDLNDGKTFDASQYTGIKLDVWGNQEDYGLHLRTKGLWFPWQAYRSNFKAMPEWKTITLPFSEFQAYKTSQALNPAKLKRIGLVAIGRDFEADICLGKVRLYRS